MENLDLGINLGFGRELSTKKETINLTKIDENFYEYKIILLGKGL